MAETNYQMEVNGLSINEEDVNQISNQASFADDRVLWELFRMQKYSGSGPQKAITTYGVQGSAPEYSLDTNALISGNTADAKVKILPFRAFVGSLDNTDSLTEKREARSGYAIGDSGPTELTLGANASGNPRWDLIKVAVSPNTEEPNVTRFIKDPITEIVTPTSLSINTSVSCVVSVTQGTPNATPARPAVPADTADTYYIVLGYVYVPDGFTAFSIVSKSLIHESAPVLTLHSSVGGNGIKPANHSHKIDGTIDVNQSGAIQTTYRPGAYLPSTMVGGESRIIVLQLGLAPKSHNDGDIVDDSVDWRFRFFKCTASLAIGTTTTSALSSDKRGTSTFLVPKPQTSGSYFVASSSGGSPTVGVGIPAWNTTLLGQSMYNDQNVFADPSYTGTALQLSHPTTTDIVNTTGMALIVDDQGRLIVRYTPTFNGQVLIWLESTGQYSNFGSV